MGLLSQPFDRPDTAIDFGRQGDLVVRAASVRGLSHRYGGKTRQDHYALRPAKNGQFLVIAVADGVSSSEDAHRAARIAADKGADRIAERLATIEPSAIPWREVINEVSILIVESTRKRLVADRPPGDPISDVDVLNFAASTVHYAILETSGDTELSHGVWSAGVGDTSLWLLDPKGWTPQAPVKNAHNAIASSAVTPLPIVPESVQPSYFRIGSRDAFFLMTDGVGDPLDSGRGSVGEELARRWLTPPDPYSFAAQVDFSRRSYDDDRTVVGIWVAEP